MTKKAKIYGKRIESDTREAEIPSHLSTKFILKEQVEVSNTRAENEAITIEFEEKDLLAIKFTDETEWIGHPEDIQEIYDRATLEKRSLTQEDYVFEAQISAVGTERGVVKRALIKVFSVFSPTEAIAQIGMEKLGVHYDKKVQPHPDIYQLDEGFRKIPFTAKKENSTYLLLLHGTLSTALDAFEGLTAHNTWSQLVANYGKHILALEHYTLSESPLKNALDFLKKCPNHCTFDIISHSRGGLVADILAKCDFNNREKQVVGFSENELTIVRKHDPVSLKLMEEINEVLKTKRIYIGKVIRVACPASGTTILSTRVDHFFNLMLNAVFLAFGIRNPLYEVVKSFMLELISQKDDPEVLAGLNSMMPESHFQKMLNSADTAVMSQLYSIAGDAEVSGVNFNSLKVILSNLFYRGANDLVVDTRRMTHGIPRQEGYYNYLSQDGQTNHFNYFKNQNTATALLQAIRATRESPAEVFSKQIYTEGERGILLDLFSMEGITYKPEKIKRDVVIVIPGIMGSTLGVDGEDQWIQMRQLNKGAIVTKLSAEATNVEASGIVKKFYSKLGDHLATKYDVYSLAFDWRKSVTGAATTLKELIEEILDENMGNLHVIAHSMGGLVVRQCMIDHANTWERMKQDKDNKFVMLGTPWRGSYLIMEVLTGHSARVKQLAAIDFHNDRGDLLKIFWNYPGVFELLPVNDTKKRKFWEAKFWNELDKEADLKHMPNVSDYTGSLKKFDDFQNKIATFLKKLDAPASKDFFDNVYYICGKADKTVFDYKFKNRFLSRHKKLVYLATSYGDGSVTWETGIPDQLKKSNRLYYTNTGHGDLANDPDMFEGIVELLEQGKTNQLSTQPPANRGAETITEVHEFSEPLLNSEQVVQTLFDIKPTFEAPQQQVNVRVVNGDLVASSYPVLVGHFYMDLILSAEKALDGYLENRLSDRMDIGYYPGQIGESEVFFNLDTNPKGAIVCGLGTTDSLTSFLLSKTIKLAVLKYAMFMRDNYTLPRAKKYARGISCMLIGIGYGKLPVEDSIKGILLGLTAANKYIKGEGAALNLQPIEEIEIVNYYESIASQAYYSLNQISTSDDRINIHLEPTISKRTGIKKKQLIADSTYKWWYNLHITTLWKDLQKAEGFKYYSSIGLARIEEEMVGVGLHKVDYLLAAYSKTSSWDPKLSKTLFEMLIPNDFKNVFRNQGNMIIKLDKRAAEIPWELLYDPQTDATPVSVASSFIRQLVTQDATNLIRVSLANQNVLVIGDPLYNNPDLPQLPAAKAEASWVTGQLNKEGYHTTSLINSSTTAIMMELYEDQYKIMHFAGHGLYNPEKDEVGIAIGNGICIDPAMIKQLGYVPEFVFINCCYSGAMEAKDEAYSQGRFELAANIGTQLIDMGVKAIIISGWAVNDAAAKLFSETFYTHMFNGNDFGTSVQKARLACFQLFRTNNTWGAYQCYGNQYYKFNSRKKSATKDFTYVIASQVYTDLDNLIISITDRKQSIEKTLQKLDNYLTKALEAGLLDAVVLEKEALIYDELGKFDIALQKYLELFTYANGNYSIEALEKYCTLISYKLNKKNVKASIAEIESLTMAGKNPSRLNIVGNAHKFASLATPTKRSKISHLKKAYGYYEQVLIAAAGNKFGGDYLDALTNMIFIGHFLELLETKEKRITLLKRLAESTIFTKVKDLEEYLLNFDKELDAYDKSDLDVSVQIGHTETKYCLLLLKKNFKPDLGMDIISRFKNIFKLRYSPRLIAIELQQIDFLLAYTEDEVIVQQLHQIADEIRKLREK